MSELSRPGATLVYEVTGDGPVVGHSHGVFMSRAAEDGWGLMDLGKLAGRRRLVRYDARAHGQSTGDTDPESYTWSRLADDLIALVDEVSAGTPVDWSGSSMGTGTLLWAATRSPERFRRLVLMNPPTTGDSRTAQAGFYRTAADLVEAQGKARVVASMQKPPIFADLDTVRFDVDIPEALLPTVLRGAGRTDLPPAEALAALTHPTLILAWENDPVHPVSTAEYLAETIPGARLHVSSTVDDIATWPDRADDFL